jgi:hypothetical protein
MALKKLHSSNYHVADDSTDIRGWKLHDTTGGTMGKVDDLLFDPATNEVRYAIIQLESGGRVNIPIGEIALDEAEHRVTATGFVHGRLSSIRATTDLDTDTEITDAVERDYYRDYHPDWQGVTPDYATDRYRSERLRSVAPIEERDRLDAPIGERVERTFEFASAAPSDTELIERRRLEEERVNKERVDVTPIDDETGFNRPI